MLNKYQFFLFIIQFYTQTKQALMEIIDATISSEWLSLSAFQIKLEILISFRNNWCTLKIINYYLIVAFKV